MEQQEITTLYRTLRLVALNELITEYAYKNRAKIVQRLLELKHTEEQKLLSNKPIQAQYDPQNTNTKGLLRREL